MYKIKIKLNKFHEWYNSQCDIDQPLGIFLKCLFSNIVIKINYLILGLWEHNKLICINKNQELMQSGVNRTNDRKIFKFSLFI